MIEETILRNAGSMAALPGHAIGFRLFNSDDEPVLYIDNYPLGHELTCEIANLSDRLLEIPALAGEAGPANYHIAIRFRAGLLSVDSNTGKFNLAVPARQGWKTAGPVQEADGVTVYFLRTGEAETLKPGKALRLTLGNVLATAASGARTTRVELLYQGLKYAGSPDSNVTGTRIELLNIVNHLGHRHAPLLYGWAGSHQVLNNGTEQTLTLHMINTRHDQDIDFSPSTQFVFSFTTEGIDEAGLLVKKDALENVSFSLTHPQKGVFGDKTSHRRILSAADCKLEKLGPSGHLEVTIKVRTSLPAGITVLTVGHEKLPGYWDNTTTLPIEKSPMIFKKDKNEKGEDIEPPTIHLHLAGELKAPNTYGAFTIECMDSNKNYVGLRMGNAKISDKELYSWIQSHHKRPLALNPEGNNVGINIKNNIAQYPLDVGGDINTSGKVKEKGHDLLPTGAIIMWSGSEVPAGWALCDGKEGRPDLRERFIVGMGRNSEFAGNGYKLNDKGGNAGFQLTTEQLPSHSHNVKINIDQVGGHDHSVKVNHGEIKVLLGDKTIKYAYPWENKDNETLLYTSKCDPHNPTARGTIEATGGNKEIDNRPPYYALAFIMKT